VVFEEIGQMSGATSYIHLSVTIDLEDLDTRATDFSRHVYTYKQKINDTFSQAIRDADRDCMRGQRFCDETRKGTLINSQMRFLKMGNRFQEDANRIRTRIINLRGILPSPTTPPESNGPTYSTNIFSRKKRGSVSSLVKSHGSSILKKAGGMILKAAKHGILRGAGSPSLIFSLAKGILGTFMGLYTQHQINKLRNQVDNLQSDHEQLVEVVAENRASIASLEAWMERLSKTISLMTRLNVGSVLAEMNNMYRDLHSALEVAVHTVQQAMHRRLAIDLLSPSDLQKIFEDLSGVATAQGFNLLTKRASDLLQVETSHIYDGVSFILLLHVPMTPADSLLRLLRLRPFPIPFSPTHSLLPRAPTSLLALSKGKTRWMTTIEYTDLVGCHQVGNVYICDRHGALRKDIKATCLGALFEQDIPEARKLCDLEVVPRKEAVLQLEGTWFLVYSPTMFTARTDCHNGTSSEAYIKRGVQRVNVDPGCDLLLTDHLLRSEFSLYLDTNVRWIKWEAEDISLFGLNENDVDAVIEESGIGGREILLADVVKATKARSKFPRWKIALIAIVILSLLSLFTLFAVPVLMRWVHRIQIRIRQLKTQIVSLLPSLAEQINHILRHLNLPQVPLQRFNLYPAVPAEHADAPHPLPPYLDE
jgi:hypothetical protein